MTEKLVIIGGGPAGLTAALYAARADLQPLVLMGPAPGGQIATTTEVENFPGFPEGLMGPELTDRIQQQAERFGARLMYGTVDALDSSVRPFVLQTSEGPIEAEALIVATGATPRKLGVPGEQEFVGRGVSYCATCDGFFFRGKELIVVGGGDSAFQEALFLTKFASRVRIVHRRDSFRAGATLQRRVQENPKIELITDTVVERIEGVDGKVTQAVLRNLRSGNVETSAVDGVFVFIGHDPNTSLVRGQVELDEHGYIRVNDRLHTSVAGIFAAGEAHDSIFRQAITSAGFGTMAALEAEKYLAGVEAEMSVLA